MSCSGTFTSVRTPGRMPRSTATLTLYAGAIPTDLPR